MDNSRLLTENDASLLSTLSEAFIYTLSLNPNQSFKNIITLYSLKIHIRA